MDNLTKFIQIVLQQSNKAIEKNEIPVGSLIFDPITNQIISKAHNKELNAFDPTAHAEIICIRNACKKLKQKRLDNLYLLTYLEPCSMCKEVIKSARISRVFYLFKNNNPLRKTIHKIKYKKVNGSYENLIKKFFKEKRIKN